MRQFVLSNLNSIDQAFNLLDEILESKVSVQKLPQAICNQGYPPSNIFTDIDNNYVINLAVAGWEQEEITIDYEDHYLIVSLLPKSEFQKEYINQQIKYIQKGIKKSESKIKILVPTKYDETKIVASYKNGILDIKLPVKEEAKPIKIKIDT